MKLNYNPTNDIIVGNVYNFEGYQCVITGVDKYAPICSLIFPNLINSVAWTGYLQPEYQTIGTNIANAYTTGKGSVLMNKISVTEYTEKPIVISDGKKSYQCEGLYLIPSFLIGSNEIFKQFPNMWLGDMVNTDEALFLNEKGEIEKAFMSSTHNISPAFNLDTRSVTLKGNKLTVKESYNDGRRILQQGFDRIKTYVLKKVRG